jgi:Zn-dependent M32 family carboxypeptidase
VASLRKELSTHLRSKDLDAHSRAHESDTKRLEKQIALLRSDMGSLKTQMAKEAAKSRAKEEAALSRVIAHVKASKPAKKIQARASKKKR